MDQRDFARLSATPKQAAHLVVELPEAEFDLAPDGLWSPRTIVAYLRDAESFAWRLRAERILAEAEPVLARFDVAHWLAARNTSRDRREELLGDFALQRQASVTLLRGLRESDFARTGTLEGDGRVTLDDVVQRWLDSDAEQVLRLESILGTTLAEVVARRFHPPE